MTELLMLGAGGHARVLQESLGLQGLSLAGYLDPGTVSRLDSVPHLGADDALRSIATASSQLVNGVGTTRASGLREAVYSKAVALGFRFLTVIDPTAIVRPSATIGAGVQVLAGAIVNTGAVIGENSIINTGAIIEHDCVLQAHVHVAPGAVLAGQVTVGARSHIGLGARVLNGVSVGSDCTIGAGAVVTRDVPDGSVAVGIPATARPER